MKFEITYANATKVVVEVVDAQLRAWLDAKAKAQALNQADKLEVARGAATALRVI